MKFKLNQGKSITLGNKEIPISQTDGCTEIPDDDIINALTNAGKKHAQADWAQNDENDPGYIKNRSLSIPTMDEDTITDIEDQSDDVFRVTTEYQLNPWTYQYSIKINNHIFSDLTFTEGSMGEFTLGDVDFEGVKLTNSGRGTQNHYIYVSSEMFPDGVDEIHIYHNALQRLPDEAIPDSLSPWIGKDPSDYVTDSNVAYVQNMSRFIIYNFNNATVTGNKDYYETSSVRGSNLFLCIYVNDGSNTRLRNIKIGDYLYPIQVFDSGELRSMTPNDIPGHNMLLIATIDYGGKHAILLNPASNS